MAAAIRDEEPVAYAATMGRRRRRARGWIGRILVTAAGMIVTALAYDQLTDEERAILDRALAEA